MLTKIMLHLKRLRLYVLILGLDVLFFAFCTPTGSAWVIIPALILVILTVWLFTRLIIQGLARVVPLKETIQRRLVRLVVVAVGLVVALQSIGQLTAKDVLTIVPLVAILYFYFAYSGTTSSEG